MVDKKKTGGAPAPAVGDARFQKVHNDPRFARLSSKKNKLQIDKRFAAVLQDDKFQSVQGKYDKYGRRIDKKQNELKKFYRLDDDDEEDGDDGDAKDDDGSSDEEAEEEAVKEKKTKAKAKKPQASSDEEGSEEEEEEDEAAEGDEKMSRLDYLNRMARGELESDSDDSDMSDEDVYMEEDEVAEKEDIPLGDETKRFAVMNCDWTRIRAVDLFALFQSFAPATGAVKDVTIYPSDFGIERMREEEQHGPRQLWADKEAAVKPAQESAADAESESASDEEKPDEEKPLKAAADIDNADDDSDDEEDDGYDSEDPLGVKKSVTANESDGFDVEKLRKYELQKLKYYYAVVTCDSVKTAAAIYENCDQLEYETSANLLDLRFIPDEMDFANKPKESCHSVPETYKPAIFATAALQQTDITLTWEEDDENRVELLTRQAEWKNANDDDFAAYLASENSSSEGEDDEDDSDDDAEVEKKPTSEAGTGDKARADRKKAAKLKKIKNRYRKMLLGSDAEDSDDDSDAPGGGSSDEGDSADDKPAGMDSDSDNDAAEPDQSGDREMTFTPGASDILRAKRQKELEANETPFERYIREKKLEKNKKRHDKRTAQKLRQQEQLEVLKKKGKAAPEQLKALRAAIDDKDGEGVNDSDDEGDRNFDMKSIAVKEKVKKLKGKRKNKELKKLDKKSGLQEGFEFDAVDPRFGKLYEKGSQFQLDPTDPKFKKTEANQAIFQERRKRQTEPKAKTATKPSAETQQQEPKSSKNELKAMVENLKRKAPPTKSKQPAAMKPSKKAKM